MSLTLRKSCISLRKIYFLVLVLFVILSSCVSIEYTLQTDGTEIIFQNVNSSVKAKGVVFLAHGCSHSALDWFPKSATCPNCIGLPIELEIVEKLLANQYVVFSTSSMDKETKCWSSHDIAPTISAIEFIYSKYLNLDYHIPLFMFGVSSGGRFIGELSSVFPKLEGNPLKDKVKIAALCVQISKSLIHSRSVPTLFMLMEKDKHLLRYTQSRVSNLILKYKQFGSIKKKFKIVSIPAMPIKHDFFTEHNVLNIEDSINLQKALMHNGIISSLSQHIVEDPRISNWREIVEQTLPHVIPKQDSLVADKSPISELLNMAWGFHEISSYNMQEVVSWFDRHA